MFCEYLNHSNDRVIVTTVQMNQKRINGDQNLLEVCIDNVELSTLRQILCLDKY